MKLVFSSIAIGACLLASSCASIETASKATNTKVPVSKNYRLSSARFAEVERAPATLRPILPKSEPFDYRADAKRRWAQQSEFEAESQALMRTLRAEELENFVQLAIEWEPDFHYRVLFKNAPEQTLARYTQNSIFKSVHAPFTESELRAHQNTVWKRLSAHNAVISGHVDVLEGHAILHTGLTREEFADIPSLTDLHDDPKIKLEFIAPFEPLEEIDPALAPHIRYLSRAEQLNGIVLSSLTKGRVVLRDGCFFLDKRNGKDPLVHFHKEVGIGLDKEGYIVIMNRMANVGIENRTARIGELAGWGDGTRTVRDRDILTPLQKACGKHPVVSIGTPFSLYGDY